MPSSPPLQPVSGSICPLRPFSPEPWNELFNPGFEEDWFHAAFAGNRRFMLLQSCDVGMAAPDGIPDHWSVTPECWDDKIHRGGKRSLHFRGSGQASQRWRWVGENGWEVGGGRYGGFVPMFGPLAEQVSLRPVKIGVWCRGQGQARLVVDIQLQSRPQADQEKPGPVAAFTRQVAFDSSSHDWQYRELEISPTELAGTPYFVTVRLEATSGEVWFDDVSLREKVGSQEINLVPNGDFEVSHQGTPSGWSAPQLWTWWRNQYYTWTGWSHEHEKSWRGGARLDPLVHFNGRASLRFDVLPGDNFSVASLPIALAQKQAQPLEARAYVRADQIRGLEIMAQDENGQWLPQGDFLGDDLQNNPSTYNLGSTGCGSYDWICLRKYFSPRRPLRSVRLFLCARGFDGERADHNLVGTVWWDDLQLYQHGAAAPAPPKSLEGESSQGLEGRQWLDLGERLFGQNRVRLSGDRPIKLVWRDPDGQSSSSQDGTYRITKPCAGPAQQYQLQVSADGFTSNYFFGTPKAPLELESNAFYAYPDEAIKLFARLNLSRIELSRPGSLEIKNGGKSLYRFKGNLAELRDAAPPPGEFYAAQNCLRWDLPSQGQQVHSWSEPIRDLQLESVLLNQDGNQIHRSRPLSVGFMEKIPAPSFPGTITSTAVDEHNRILINGQPYLPIYWAPNFDRAHEGNYPPRLWGCPSLDLANTSPEVQAQVQSNPRFFAYELGEGEMQLQGAGWLARLAQVADQARKIRAQDPRHLINGPESWLIGHPGHDQALPSFTPIFDVVGVETSFEEVPQADRQRSAGHPCAVLAGLEAYYYQPPDSLRWRGYRALLEGCSGVGLCPSEMLKASPAHLNYLRGLNGEFRGLEKALLAPAERAPAAGAGVQCFARNLGGRHYLFAMSAPDHKRFPLEVEFQGIQGTVKVRGEGREIQARGTLKDSFSSPYSVHVYEY
ncbi:MAG: hypothetical protein U0931_28020 [Vulcanimicrobiota bacterium]